MGRLVAPLPDGDAPVRQVTNPRLRSRSRDRAGIEGWCTVGDGLDHQNINRPSCASSRRGRVIFEIARSAAASRRISRAALVADFREYKTGDKVRDHIRSPTSVGSSVSGRIDACALVRPSFSLPRSCVRDSRRQEATLVLAIDSSERFRWHQADGLRPFSNCSRTRKAPGDRRASIRSTPKSR